MATRVLPAAATIGAVIGPSASGQPVVGVVLIWGPERVAIAHPARAMVARMGRASWRNRAWQTDIDLISFSGERADVKKWFGGCFLQTTFLLCCIDSRAPYEPVGLAAAPRRHVIVRVVAPTEGRWNTPPQAVALEFLGVHVQVARAGLFGTCVADDVVGANDAADADVDAAHVQVFGAVFDAADGYIHIDASPGGRIDIGDGHVVVHGVECFAALVAKVKRVVVVVGIDVKSFTIPRAV